MNLTKNQKTLLSILAISIAMGGFFVLYDYVPKIGGKIFLAAFLFLIVKFVIELVKNQRNN